MAKQRCLKLYLNNTYDDKKFKIKEGKIKDGNDNIGVTPICVLTENKPRRKFWRSARTLVLFVAGAMNALSFSEAIEDLQMYWGKKEATEYVDKLVALSVVEVKPLKMWQFFVIILMLMVAIGVGIANLQKLGALGL